MTEALTLRDGYAYWRPEGSVTPETCVELIRTIAAECEARQVTRLMFDARKLVPVNFSVRERYRVVVEVARFWDKSILMAVVGTMGHLSVFDYFSLYVAVQSGLRIRECDSEESGAKWLEAG